MCEPVQVAYPRAYDLAYRSHFGQIRRWANEPYVNHPVRVATLVRPYVSPNGVRAALLHDVLEDTRTTKLEIYNLCGAQVAYMVECLTEDRWGNRETRKRLYRQQVAKCGREVQTIKCADIFDNAPSIRDNDLGFYYDVYQEECLEMLKVLGKAEREVWDAAWEAVNQ